MYLNADQLLNKMEDLRALISNVYPDLLIITEVIPKAQRNPIPEPLMNIDGYEKFTNFKFTEELLGTSGRRGVAIYVNNKLETEVVNLNSDYEDHLWVEIKLRNKDTLLCGCIYRTPAKESAKVAETTKSVCEAINEAIKRNNSHVLICGDFNYPSIDWDCEYAHNELIKPFIETLQEHNLHQHVCNPTRYREGQEPSLLDLIMSTEEGMVHNLQHNPGLGDSDHECLSFDLNCYKEDDIDTYKPNYQKADYDTIRGKLNIDWRNKLNRSFLEDYEYFVTVLGQSMEGCVPNKMKRKKRKSIYMSLDAIKLKDL
jgi:exonuclease III